MTPIEDLLQSLLGGAAAGGSGEQNQVPAMGDLLQGLLGGGAAAQPGPQAGADPGAALPDLLGSLLGGGGGGMGGLLGGLLGGGGNSGGLLGGSSVANNALLAPISQAIAERFGLSPAVAQAVVAFALTTILPAIIKSLSKEQAGATSGAPMPTPAQPSGGLDMSDLLQQMTSGQRVGAGYLRSNGLAQQLASQTGLDEETAATSLDEALAMLGEIMAEPPAQADDAPPSSPLDGLLDAWNNPENQGPSLGGA